MIKIKSVSVAYLRTEMVKSFEMAWLGCLMCAAASRPILAMSSSSPVEHVAPVCLEDKPYTDTRSMTESSVNVFALPLPQSAAEAPETAKRLFSKERERRANAERAEAYS